MKILVTGSRGFIGQHVMKALEGSEHIPVPFDLLDGQDVGRLAHLIPALDGIDAVINLAGRVRIPESLRDARNHWRDNAFGAAAVMTECRRQGIRVVQASTSAVNDVHNHYSASKRAAETAAVIEREAGLDIHVIRIHNVYGPGQPTDFVVPAMMLRARDGEPLLLHNGGLERRDFIFIDDVVQAFITAATDPEIEAFRLDAATGKQTSIQELAGDVWKAMGTGPVRVEDVESDRQPVMTSEPYLPAWKGRWSSFYTLEAGLTVTAAAMGGRA